MYPHHQDSLCFARRSLAMNSLSPLQTRSTLAALQKRCLFGAWAGANSTLLCLILVVVVILDIFILI